MLAAGSGPTVRGAPLFGRPEVAEEILRVLDETRREGAGRFLFLLGQGGVGKSTVLRSVVASAGAHGYSVLQGRCLPVETPRPFGLVEDLLHAAQGLAGEGDRAADAANSLPLYAAIFDPGPKESHGDRGAPFGEPPRSATEADHLLEVLANPVERIDADRSSLFGRLTDFFRQLARDAPLFVAIDDVQFADESSLECLRQLAATLTDTRLVLVTTSQPLAEAPPRTITLLERLAASPRTATLWLRPMTESELTEFVRWLLNGRDPGRDSVMRWFSQTEGNPLFTEYLVRATTGFAAPGGGASEGATPDLGELLRARVRRLSEGEQRVLVHAAVLGKEFQFATLEVACGEEEERLSESLDHLVHEGLIREAGGEVYEFVSERARVDVYSQLTETRRRLLHRKVARALMTRDGVTNANLYELARQFFLGRDDPMAVELNGRAADAAARAFAFDTAVVHIERALECQRRIVPRDLAIELRMLIELGRYHDELGDLPRSEEVLVDAVARARALPNDPTDLAYALLGLAQTRCDVAQFASGRDLANEAYDLLKALDHKKGLLAAHRALGLAYWRLGELDKAEEHQRAELALAEAVGTPAEHGHALIDLANTYSHKGKENLAETLALYQTAAGIFAEIRNPSAEARVLMNRALLHHFAGQTEEALRVMTEAFAAAERSRSPIWIGYCSLNLAQFYTERGDTKAASPLIDRAIALLDPLGDQLAHQQTTMIRGMIAELDGDYPVAEATFQDALSLARQLSLSAEVAEMLYRLAGLSLRLGDLPRAKLYLAEAREAGIATLHGDLLPKVDALAQRIEAAPP
ncbi:MAG: AAA family ATPase [Thermoplasmata archaeon]|nr:AAA family ATPase [Thermoplasmata archaeon]